MAFDELPIIDKASINSEKSEINVSLYLNQQSGFICRRDVPDKGCDLDVELILNKKNNSNWRFALQIKSVDNLNLIKEAIFISLSFETSRIGYLARRIPAYGYIVLYSTKENICYYDSVDNIINRLLDERINDQWKKQNEVSIHIPTANILNHEAAKLIHQRMAQRFENATLLQNSWGHAYNLPNVDFGDKKKYDWRHPGSLVKFLNEYGISLLSSYDISFLYDLIIQVPHAQILNSSELLYIATVTFCEVGKNTDARFYLEKCKRKSLDFSRDQREVIEFYEHKILFALGEITAESFISLLKRFIKNENTTHNSILLRMNAMYFELLTIKGLQKIPVLIDAEIADIFRAIDESNIDETIKWKLRIWNCDNFVQYSRISMHASASEIQIRETLGAVVSLDEKFRNVRSMINIQKFINNLLKDAKAFGDSNNEELISAYAMSTFSRNFLSNQINYISLSPGKSSKAEQSFDFDNQIKLCLSSADVFYNNKLLKEAYVSLCNSIEIYNVANEYYGLNLIFPADINSLEENIKSLESEYPTDQVHLFCAVNSG